MIDTWDGSACAVCPACHLFPTVDECRVCIIYRLEAPWHLGESLLEPRAGHRCLIPTHTLSLSLSSRGTDIDWPKSVETGPRVSESRAPAVPLLTSSCDYFCNSCFGGWLWLVRLDCRWRHDSHLGHLEQRGGHRGRFFALLCFALHAEPVRDVPRSTGHAHFPYPELSSRRSVRICGAGASPSACSCEGGIPGGESDGRRADGSRHWHCAEEEEDPKS